MKNEGSSSLVVGIRMDEGKLNSSRKPAVRSNVEAEVQFHLGSGTIVCPGAAKRAEILRVWGLLSMLPWVSFPEQGLGADSTPAFVLLSKYLRKCKLLFQITFANKNGSLLQIFS